MKRSAVQLIALLFLAGAQPSADASIFGLIYSVADLAYKTFSETDRSRWPDILESNPKVKSGDFRGAYEIVQQAYESRLERNPEPSLDDVQRLKLLSIWAPQAGKVRNFDELLAGQESRFDRANNPMTSGYYWLLRSSSAAAMNRVRESRINRDRAMSHFHTITASGIKEWGFLDRFAANFSADRFSRQLEIDTFRHTADLLFSSAKAAHFDGQELEALDLAKQSSYYVDRYYAEIKKLNEQFNPAANANRASAYIPYFSYVAGLDKSADEAIVKLQGLKPTPGDFLSSLYMDTGRYEDAEILMRSVVVSTEKNRATPILQRFINASLLSQALIAQGNFGEAERVLQRALNELNASATDIPEIASEGLAILNGLLTETRLRQGTKQQEAAQSAHDSFDAMKRQLTGSESIRFRLYFLKEDRWKNIRGNQVVALARSEPDGAGLFEAMQLAKNSQVAETLNEVSARLSMGSDELSTLVRRTLDLKVEIKGVSTQLANSGPSAKAETLKSLRDERAHLSGLLIRTSEEIAAKYPAYVELTQPRMIAVEETQRLLQPTEALVSWTVGENESVLMVVRRDGVKSHVIPVGRESLRAMVNQLQLQLEPNGISPTSFNAQQAYELYAKWLMPGKEMLAGAKHLILVTDDALGNIPLAIMMTSPPRSGAEVMNTNAQLVGAPWLVKEYSFSVLPGISSLKALRQTINPTRAGKPFVGFGDPLFPDHPLLTKTASRVASARAPLRNLRSSDADIDLLKSIPSLPETADELNTIASTLGAEPSTVHLRERATETAVRTTPLLDFRVMAFATHGIVSGDVSGINEPGLLMTPPEAPGPEDDGILTASEVASLKLDADWVLLSACNTGASDGKPGSEGHSGLGKAFLFAGARSILLSHWSVPSQSTALLTTGMLQSYSRKQISKAAAHQEAMLQLIQANRGKYAHPTYWAPFVLLGDGAQTLPATGNNIGAAIPNKPSEDNLAGRASPGKR